MIVARERLIIPTIVDSSSVLGSAIWPVVVRLGSNAIGYAKHRTRSHDAVIRVYDAAGNVIQTHEHAAISKNREDHGIGAERLRIIFDGRELEVRARPATNNRRRSRVRVAADFDGKFRQGPVDQTFQIFRRAG